MWPPGRRGENSGGWHTRTACPPRNPASLTLDGPPALWAFCWKLTVQKAKTGQTHARTVLMTSADAAVAAGRRPGQVAVAGFADGHAHLLQVAAGVPAPWQETTVAAFHHEVARAGQTPMDVAHPPPPAPREQMAARLRTGLAEAAAAGLVEVTEMGMRAWWYLDALTLLQRHGPLPARVRIYLSSGLAEQSSWPELEDRRAAAGPWASLDGVKFYADGWLVPRTCAMCLPFADQGGDGLLFLDAATLARRIEPFAARGWRIATHAIGDRAIATVLDAYELAWGGDAAALGAASPRIEHASVQSGELTARIAETGVTVCLQPSFAVTDAGDTWPALGPGRAEGAYPWRALAGSGARLLAGSDYPIEVIEPLAGLARLVNGRCERPGFRDAMPAPPGSRLDAATALRLMSDAAAGETCLSADPGTVPAGELDRIEVCGTSPRPFA
jgi:predicted amidohydrolase YtcJ